MFGHCWFNEEIRDVQMYVRTEEVLIMIEQFDQSKRRSTECEPIGLVLIGYLLDVQHRAPHLPHFHLHVTRQTTQFQSGRKLLFKRNIEPSTFEDNLSGTSLLSSVTIIIRSLFMTTFVTLCEHCVNCRQ